MPSMKFAAGRPFADPAIAARKLIEIASGIEPVQDPCGMWPNRGSARRPIMGLGR